MDVDPGSRPELAWRLRDHLEDRARPRGGSAEPYTVPAEEARARAAGWFPLTSRRC